MNRRALPSIRLCVSMALVSLSFCAALAQGAGAAKGKPEAPDAVVKALYADHFAHRQNLDVTFKRNRARFAPELLRLLDESARKQAARPDEIVGLDFDALTDAQEEANGFEVGRPIYQQAEAVVPVAVRFGPDPTTIRVHLRLVGGRWRIANIAYDESDLVAILKSPQN